MKCLQCGHENRADGAFCDECGAGLEASCPGCRERDYDEAVRFGQEALSIARTLGDRSIEVVATSFLGNTHAARVGKLSRRTGKSEQAREHLTAATTMYREMDMRFWLEQA